MIEATLKSEDKHQLIGKFCDMEPPASQDADQQGLFQGKMSFSMVVDEVEEAKSDAGSDEHPGMDLS